MTQHHTQFDNLPAAGWGRFALAFRGYNQSNLGRTRELLDVHAYRDIVLSHLGEGSEVCAEVLGQRVDLKTRIEDRCEPRLEEYAEAVALVMAIEMAQIDLLKSVHGFAYCDATHSFGYSLGEVVAVAASGLLQPRDAMRVPIALATDCAALADDTTMAVIFSRREKIAENDLKQLCLETTSQGNGVVAISAVLSPNTYLVIGQGNTIDRIERAAKETLGQRVSVRRNPDRWPPLHTEIVRQRHVPDRAGLLMSSAPVLADCPRPIVFSLTSGQADYNPITTRDILRDWADHPQRLWDAVRFTLHEGVETVVHVGPEPNVIPATFSRLAENISQQLSEFSIRGYGTRAMANLARRGWLSSLLPRDSALLHAPRVRHVILEDWLLANKPN